MMAVLVCIECIRNDQMPEPGTQITTDPPFAITMMSGDALCKDHARMVTGVSR